MHIRLRQLDRALHRRAAFMKALEDALPLAGLPPSERGILQIVFLPRDEMAELNALHLHHEGATDVITYDLREKSANVPLLPGESPDSRVLAELYVCPSVATEYAISCHTSLSHELFLYCIHGMLHLAGEDDLTETARASMRAAERRVLDAVKALGHDINSF